jgi:hypothetical protein
VIPWNYDGTTGFLRLYDAALPSCGMDPSLGPPPTAVLSPSHDLPVEHPVFGVTHEGVYISPGLAETLVTDRLDGEAETPARVTLVFPYTGEISDPVNLAGASYPSAFDCVDWQAFGWPPYAIQQVGGLVIRGSNLLADGSLTLSDDLGRWLAGDLGWPVFLDDRIVVRTEYAYGYGSYGPPRTAPPPAITGVQTPRAFIEYSSPRGAASTPGPIGWLGAPAVESIGPASFVTYGEVMTLTGRFFSRVTEVAFTWAGLVEQLTPTASSPPGPGQFHVFSENQIEVLLPSDGGVVPRALAARCVRGVVVQDVFPGTRSFTVRNTAGSGSATTSAVDPSGTAVAVPVPTCPVVFEGGGSGSSSPEPVLPGISLFPPMPLPGRNDGNCSNGSGCSGY